jgi:isopentenyl diphosphate isomerase/L-lactate dehydrogenase-like FMN-dependent dehydrogenase
VLVLAWFSVLGLHPRLKKLRKVPQRARIRRAEKEGYKALVVTVDAPYRGSTTKDPLYMPPHLSYINVELYNCVLNNPDTATEEELTGVNPKNTWDMIQWLRSV